MINQVANHTIKQQTINVTVVHLVWLPYGIELFRSFIGSYVRYPAGADHRLLILFNGIKDEAETRAYHELIGKYGITYSSKYLSGGQDIDAYFFAAKEIKTDYLFFLNSFSVLNTSDWLLKYIPAFDSSTGIISATASNQSHVSLVFQNNNFRYESSKGFLINFRKYKLMLKAFFYWRSLFKPFPNPHLRSNAFMIRRDIFLSLKRIPIKNKLDAYRFESGRNGMTIQILKKGLHALVIDKHGKTYEPHEWKDSKTFWWANQENLMISDNQTRIYDNASPAEKEFMSKTAWGFNE